MVIVLEDLFDRDYYLAKADVAYAKELSGKKLKDLRLAAYH
jgi:hypothetical protein